MNQVKSQEVTGNNFNISDLTFLEPCPLGSRLSRLLDALRLSSEAIDPDLARGYNLDCCFCLQSRLPEEQLQEVVYRFQLE